ncbi:hypothetical protein, partial [Vibrio parahaemolyticus]|uniref:hypothetical protein n=1 Tax=Vibrio parahaemolyticus TaxID=670 RepID=UPI001C5CD714
AAAKRHSSSSSNTPKTNHSAGPPPALNYRAKKPAFKLYERRPSMKNLKMISPSASAAGSMMMTSQNYSPA